MLSLGLRLGQAEAEAESGRGGCRGNRLDLGGEAHAEAQSNRVAENLARAGGGGGWGCSEK